MTLYQPEVLQNFTDLPFWSFGRFCSRSGNILRRQVAKAAWEPDDELRKAMLTLARLVQVLDLPVLK